MEDLTTTAARNDISIDEIYLKIWEKQQDRTGTVWNIIIFFLSVSFALFGLSFQDQTLTVASKVQRITGLAVYWFAYLIFLRYSDWSKYLRNYLEKLEITTQTQLTLHTGWKKTVQTPFCKWTSITKLIFYFGLFYTIAVVWFWLLGM